MITFKTKIKSMIDPDGNEIDRYIDVPTLKRNHCDMSFFRQHKRYGGFANSDLFPSMLAKIRASVLSNKYGGYIKLSQIPANVTVDESGFLANVTIHID